MRERMTTQEVEYFWEQIKTKTLKKQEIPTEFCPEKQARCNYLANRPSRRASRAQLIQR
ncbi:hypothetical protein JCM15765_30660 [Paradesulfitobacterium aromaticivorans]